MVSPRTDPAAEIAAAVAVALAKSTSDTAIQVAKTAADAATAVAVIASAMGSDVKFIKDEIQTLSKEVKDGFHVMHEKIITTNAKVSESERQIAVIQQSGLSMGVYQNALWAVVVVLVGMVVYFVQRGAVEKPAEARIPHGYYLAPIQPVTPEK